MIWLSLAGYNMFKLKIVFPLISAVLAIPQVRAGPLSDGRIIGGDDADIKDYPYQLSLQFLGNHRCGAVTISPTWALTAAHCIDGTISYMLLSIRAGSSYHNTGGRIVYLSETIVHPNYNSSASHDYDIALLHLNSALSPEDSTPIPLPSTDRAPAVGSSTIISGWGVTAESGLPSDVLQVIRVPVINQNDCKAAYTDEVVTDRMFCAGLLGVGGKDACQGDSGGPVIVNGTVVGLVSWGDGCGRPDSPGVYTNVAALRDWIEEVTGL